jgi:hypothetical protein
MRGRRHFTILPPRQEQEVSTLRARPLFLVHACDACGELTIRPGPCPECVQRGSDSWE